MPRKLLGRKLTWVVLLSTAIVVVALHYARNASATAADSGFKATTIATGTFDKFDVFNHSSKKELPVGFDGDAWLSLQRRWGHRICTCKAMSGSLSTRQRER